MIYGQILIQGWKQYLRLFTEISAMAVVDLLQLPPFRGKLKLFKLVIELLNKTRVGNIHEDVNCLKQDLPMDLMKAIQKMLCTCTQRSNLLLKRMMLL